MAAQTIEMTFDYTIRYRSENHYESPVYEAYWQFLVTPENNSTQKLVSATFTTSLNARIEQTENGYGFKACRIHCKQSFQDINFDAEFTLTKKEVNPFDFVQNPDIEFGYNQLAQLAFKVDFEAYLKSTVLTTLPEKTQNLFVFNKSKSIFDNCCALNSFIFNLITFTTGVTTVTTTLEEIVQHKKGVCQDFTQLFCALARQNNIPARYISGYLHQGEGFFGDSQMHAWAELYIPELGWVGFDPTNNLLANHNHIKVAHGKDYNDCPPIKGIVYATGRNYTKYTVEVTHQQ